MKRETISNAMGRICNEYIAEAETYRSPDRDGRILYRIAAACAAVLLAVAAVPLLVNDGVLSGIVAAFQPKRGNVVALNVTDVIYDNKYLQSFAGDEYAPWSSERGYTRQDPDAPQTYTVEFMGKTYAGEYKWTELGRYDPYDTHMYGFDGGGFTVRSDTGELSMIMFVPSIGGVSTSAGAFETLDEETYKAAAEKIACEYIDIGNYTQSVEIADSYANYNTVFGCISGMFTNVTFTSEIEGISTSESLTVTIMNDESLYRFAMHSAGLFDDADRGVIARLADSDEATAEAERKLAEIYGGDLDSFELSGKRIVMLEGGVPGVVYTYQVSFTARSEGRDETYELTAELLLVLGDEDIDEGGSVSESETEMIRDPFDESDPFAVSEENIISRAEAERITEGMTLSEIVGVIGLPNTVNTNNYPTATYNIGDYDEHHLTVIYDRTDEVDGQLRSVSVYIEDEYSITDTDPDNLKASDDAGVLKVIEYAENGEFVPFSAVVDMIGKPNRVLDVEEADDPPYWGDYIAEYDLADGKALRVRYGTANVMSLYSGCVVRYAMCEAVILPEPNE